MSKNKYLIRLDDACPTMDKKRWDRIEAALEKYNIRPMVGVIPDNKDKDQFLNTPDPTFWGKVKKWESKGWAIAMHGYDHCYLTNDGGVNPLWKRSEFAGVDLQKQKEKIRNGVSIMRKNGINPKYFFAPSHTFDINTLKALISESDIRIISDTIATKPYKWKGFSFVPQLGGRCREMKIPGIWTACLHPSTMSDEDIMALEDFISRHYSEFISFQDIDYARLKSKTLLSKIFSMAYFAKRMLLKP